MEALFTSLLQTLPVVAKRPLALAAYGIAVIAYLVLGWRMARHRELPQHLTKLPKEVRLRALQTVMSEILPASVTFDQWMRMRRQRYVFWGAVIAGVTIEDSMLDNEPCRMVRGAGEEGRFWIRNDGWQKIVDGKATIDLYGHEACPQHSLLFDAGTSIPKEPSIKPWATPCAIWRTCRADICH